MANSKARMMSLYAAAISIGAVVATGCAGANTAESDPNGSGGTPEAGGMNGTSVGTSSSSSTTSSSGGAGASVGGVTALATAPTWTQLYSQYLGPGTVGHCVDCHSFGSTSSSLYAELVALGEIDGTQSSIASTGSILTWFGGPMPQGGPKSLAAAVTAFKAWVAAGARQN